MSGSISGPYLIVIASSFSGFSGFDLIKAGIGRSAGSLRRLLLRRRLSFDEDGNRENRFNGILGGFSSVLDNDWLDSPETLSSSSTSNSTGNYDKFQKLGDVCGV